MPLIEVMRAGFNLVTYVFFSFAELLLLMFHCTDICAQR
jgi:hypothetical protein